MYAHNYSVLVVFLSDRALVLSASSIGFQADFQDAPQKGGIIILFAYSTALGPGAARTSSVISGSRSTPSSPVLLMLYV
jgi:hypothetical protein